MKRLTNYIKDSVLELHHVTWPTQKQLIRLTLMTIAFVALSTLLLGIVDYLFSLGFNTLLHFSR